MAELARDASSSDGLCAALETFIFSSDVGGMRCRTGREMMKQC